MNRLVDRGPYTVLVTPMVKKRDITGAYALTPGSPVKVSGVQVQPTTAEELGTNILTAPTSYRVIGAGVWPGGVHSKVEWNGRQFTQNGEASIYSNSPTTAHFDVMIVSQSSEVK